MPMKKDAVLRFDNDVGLFVSIQRLGQIHAEYLKLAIVGLAIDLGIVEAGIASRSTSQIDSISQMRCPVRQMIPGIADFSTNRNDRRIFKIVLTEDANRIKRFKDHILILTRERVS